MTDSSIRVEIAIRAGMIAKAALEMVSLDPRLVSLQLREVVKQVQELDLRVKASLTTDH